MAKILTCVAYRCGTSKTRISANLAVLLAMRGQRVGILDCDFAGSGMQTPFGLDLEPSQLTLNDCLWGKCDIIQTVCDLSSRFGSDFPGKLFLCPSSSKVGDVARVLREGFDIGVLNDAIHKFGEALKLDILVVDAQSGFSEITLFSMSIANMLVIFTLADAQHFQGTGVSVEVGRKLEVPKVGILVNQVPILWKAPLDDIKKRMETVYNCPVVAAFRYSADFHTLISSGIFVHRDPDHPITKGLQNVADFVLS